MTGLWIDRMVPAIKPGYLRSLAVGLLCVYSHALLDALSPLTYHPTDPAPGDAFWLGYHAGLVGVSLRVWKKHPQRQQRLAMLCSVLPDLDWLFIKTPSLFGWKAFAQRPALHELLFKTLFSLPLLRLLNHLPNLRQRKAAALVEFMVYLVISS